MTQVRTVLVCPSLPPLRLDRSLSPHAVGPSGLVTLSRGLLVMAALALPAFGLRLADLGRSPDPRTTQAAAVPISPPVWTAAARHLR